MITNDIEEILMNLFFVQNLWVTTVVFLLFEFSKNRFSEILHQRKSI